MVDCVDAASPVAVATYTAYGAQPSPQAFPTDNDPNNTTVSRLRRWCLRLWYLVRIGGGRCGVVFVGGKGVFADEGFRDI